MKKTFAGLVAAPLAAVLIAFSAPAATAGPYTGTVPTKATAVAPATVEAGSPVVIKFKLADASNKTPKGKIVVKVFNKAGKRVDRVVYTYDADRKRYSAGELPKGRYTLVTKFVPKAGSVFKKSRSTAATKVV